MTTTPTTSEELDQFISEPTDAVVETVGNCPGTYAVLGAGGKMGLHLSLMLRRALDKLGRTDAVTTISRFGSKSARAQFDSAGFNVISADLSDPHTVKRLPDFDNVFFLAGVKFGAGDQPELLRRMNITMPQLVARQYHSSRIVALSTGCVYSFSTSGSHGSTEESPTDPPGTYAQSCNGREAAFTDAANRFGTRSSLIRLNYSIDLRYGVLLDIARKVQARLPVNVDMGYANVIWQGDAIAHTIQSLASASAPPFILNVTGADVLSVRELAMDFASRFGCEAEIQGMEHPTAWLSNAAKSHAMFGPPKVSVDQMVDWVVEWLKMDGVTLGKPTHFQVRDGGY